MTVPIVLMLSLLALAFPAAGATKPVAPVGAGCNNQQRTTPGVALQCFAYTVPVSGYPNPTGTIGFSVASSKGSISPSTCNVTSGCTVYYTATGNGSAYRKDVITVTYYGDAVYGTSKTSITVAVGPKPAPGLSLTCPQTTTPATTIRCAASVTAIAGLGAPTGTLSFTAPSYKGIISPASCNAASGTCYVFYTPKGTGTPTRTDTVTATYSGDARYGTAKATAQVLVHAP